MHAAQLACRQGPQQWDEVLDVAWPTYSPIAGQGAAAWWLPARSTKQREVHVMHGLTAPSAGRGGAVRWQPALGASNGGVLQRSGTIMHAAHVACRQAPQQGQEELHAVWPTRTECWAWGSCQVAASSRRESPCALLSGASSGSPGCRLLLGASLHQTSIHCQVDRAGAQIISWAPPLGCRSRQAGDRRFTAARPWKHRQLTLQQPPQTRR